MEDAKRRATIRNLAAKRKETDEGAMGTGSSRPLAKKRPLLKGDRAPKKQKVSTEPVIGLMVEGNKTVTPAKHGGGKGLMVPPPASQKKPPVLLCEDLKYALEKLSSIIGNEDHKDLGTTQRRPWGRRAFLILPRYEPVIIFPSDYTFIYSSFIYLFIFFKPNSILSLGYAHDKGFDGSVSSSRDGA